MCSRVLGLAREQIFAALFGGTAYADAFQAAFRIPNLLRDLFAEGVLSAAFVPTFTDVMAQEGRERAFRLANLVIGILLVLVGGIALAGVLAAPLLVSVVAPGFDLGKQALAIPATRIIFPFLPIISIAAVLMGQLNAQDRFGAPALAPVVFNLVAITAGGWLLVSGVAPETALMTWAGAMTIGGMGQLLVQVPALRATGFRFSPIRQLRELGRRVFHDPGVRRIAGLMAPATAGLAATHVNILVSTMFASSEAGALSWLNYGFRLIYLPIGVFGVAVATVATSRLAQRAAERDLTGLRATYEQGLRLVGFLTIPSTVGLIVLREPIVRLLFERGEFLARDTTATATAVLAYAVGLYAYSAVKVTAPAFYALNQARVPMRASLFAVETNLIISVTLFPIYGFPVLALGVAAGAIVNLTLLVFALHHVTEGLALRSLAWHGLRVALAAIPCGASAVAVSSALAAPDGGLIALATQVIAAVAAGVLAYALACLLLRVDEASALLARVRRR